MNLSALWDTTGFAIVLGGTLLATVLGSGRSEIGKSVAALLTLLRPRFDLPRARAEIARDVEIIRHDGLLRAQSCHTSDEEILAATSALIHDRSLASMLATHDRFRRERLAMREKAIGPLKLAAELSPVFGMVGTLFALSQLNLSAVDESHLMAGIGQAVLTTLYGLLLAHLLFYPVVRLIARRGEDEDADREALMRWLAETVEQGCPSTTAERLARAGV
ncbi:MotA/TolQ/ExbB proton channel family protein [Erythrobacter sp. EC-HK427]|uniref:MotA/TolQ/ExbB proton channel family protein n=1 Tax=Erythrobacter sp. EC-HK427 TaxID=2038396 RepID=UPI00125C6CAB|nr:MotA/TolQ/ExbB proton channel family protein [Erythrobacter sp. EC-HK427]VVT01544.1 conserved membrane hypothetical protein [Erythrobacter sp. EC-HK427]